MGKEATCQGHFNRHKSEGKLQLETDDLVFRGDFRLKIPLKQITQATADNGRLKIVSPEGEAAFVLGPAAAKWAEAINNPKSLLDKLGVRPGHKVSVLGVQDDAFLADLKSRVGSITTGKAASQSDLVFFQADEPAELKKLEKLAAVLTPAGAVWVITPKKRPEIADTVVMKAGKAAGLVDVKVARFSDSHTALKFVVPKAKR
jgi:hypothetical protein